MAAGGGCCDVFLWWLWVAMLGDAGADPVFFQEGGCKTKIGYYFGDEKAIDTRSQTSSETSQRGGGGCNPSTLHLDPPLGSLYASTQKFIKRTIDGIGLTVYKLFN